MNERVLWSKRNTRLWILNSNKQFLVSRFRLIRIGMGGNISNLPRSRISTDDKLLFLIPAQAQYKLGLLQDRYGSSYKKYIFHLSLWTWCSGHDTGIHTSDTMKLTWLTNIFQQRILTGTHTQSVVQVPPSECARKRKCKTRSSMIILMTILLLVYEGFSVELGNNNSKVSTIYLLSSSSIHCIGVHTHSASELLSTHEMRWDQLCGGVGGEVAGTMTDGWTQGKMSLPIWRFQLDTRDCLCSPVHSVCDPS